MLLSSSGGRAGGRRPAALASAALLAGTTFLAAALLAAAALPLRAQESEVPTLDAVAAAADSGRLERARSLLERWRTGAAPEAGLEQLRRAEFLGARLAADADSARRRYARLAVEAGGELGARARLRLAQLQLAEGKAEPALRQLELVRSDVPGDSLAKASWLWTGRARLAVGDTSGACDALRRAADGGPELRALAARAARGCGLEAPGEPVAVADDGAVGEDAGEATAAGWVVQLGAFSDRAAAERVRERAADAGWEARRLPPGPDGLHRVRVGPWEDRAAAEEAVRSLEEDGFRALVVEVRSTDDGP